MGTVGLKLPPRTKHRIEPGMRFGRSVALRPAERRNGYARWWFRCDCGKERNLAINSVFKGKSHQCVDCQRVNQSGNKHPAWRGYGDIPSSAYSHFKGQAERRGFEFNVTIEQLDAIWKRQGGVCALSGRSLTMKRGNRHQSNCSLDRIDSGLGYSPSNLQFVRVEVNFAKQAMSDADFIAMCRDVARWQA